MSTAVQTLIRDIEVFIADAGMKESTFGRLAVNDGKFVSRIREGAGITLKTVDRVHTYIAAERERLAKPARPKRRRPADGAGRREAA